MAGKANRGLFGLVAAAGVAVLLMLAGCGTSDGSSSSLTNDQFVSQGNAICKKWQQAREDSLAKAQQEIAPPVTQKKVEKFILGVLGGYEGSIHELAELQAPEKDQKQVEAMIASMEEGIARAKAHPQSLLQGNLPFKNSNKEAEGYGLTECVV